MKRYLPILFFAFLSFPPFVKAQENLFNHVYWQVEGGHDGQDYGSMGLNYLGRLNDTIQHAMAINIDPAFGKRGASLIYNRFPLDTTTHFLFPGQTVVRCNMNNDSFPDFVCWDANGYPVNGNQIRYMTVLFGTARPDSFVTAAVIHGTGHNYSLIDIQFIVADVDSSGTDDIIICDEGYEDDNGSNVSRIMWYKGGPVIDTIPQTMDGGPYHPRSPCIGHVRDKNKMYLSVIAGTNSTTATANIFLYPFGPQFRLKAADTVTFDLSGEGVSQQTLKLYDADGDSVDDFFLGTYGAVNIYKGGPTISTTRMIALHPPKWDGDPGAFGLTIADVGNVTGFGYHTLAVGAYAGSINGGTGNGAVFLFNLGKNIKDSCVAYGGNTDGFNDHFGTFIVGVGDLDSDGRDEFVISSNDNNLGHVVVFHGTDSLGPKVGVSDENFLPTEIALHQNYPNPANTNTRVSFADFVDGLRSSSVLEVCDMLGRVVQTPYRGTADGTLHTVHISTAALPAGAYLLRLRNGTREEMRMMNVVH